MPLSLRKRWTLPYHTLQFSFVSLPTAPIDSMHNYIIIISNYIIIINTSLYELLYIVLLVIILLGIICKTCMQCEKIYVKLM